MTSPWRIERRRRVLEQLDDALGFVRAEDRDGWREIIVSSSDDYTRGTIVDAIVARIPNAWFSTP